MAVVGDSSAASPVISGSSSRISAASSQRTPGTPFAAARRSISRSFAVSASSRATTSFPRASQGSRRSAQYALSSSTPRRHSVALAEPGW